MRRRPSSRPQSPTTGGGGATRASLRPLIDVIDRYAPGIVELTTVSGVAGFDVRLAERPFPQEYQDDLRRAVEAALARLAAEAPSPAPAGPGGPGVLRRVLGAIQRLFSASA